MWCAEIHSCHSIGAPILANFQPDLVDVFPVLGNATDFCLQVDLIGCICILSAQSFNAKHLLHACYVMLDLIDIDCRTLRIACAGLVGVSAKVSLDQHIISFPERLDDVFCPGGAVKQCFREIGFHRLFKPGLSMVADPPANRHTIGHGQCTKTLISIDVGDPSS